MSMLDKFERGIERAINTPFAALHKSQVKPVELASRLRREIDDKAATLSWDRTVAPNHFTVGLSPDDYAQVNEWGAQALALELANNLTEYAAEQHYAFLGPVDVEFVERFELKPGNMQVQGETVQRAVAPVTGVADRHPILDIDGQRYLLTGQVTVLGRDKDADIVIDDPGVSRRHLEIRVTPAGVIATDLGSTNGLFVEGHQVPAATLLDGNTLTIGRTQIIYWEGTPQGQVGG